VAVPLLVAIGIFGVILLVRVSGVRHGAVYALLGIAMWAALFSSGVEPPSLAWQWDC
jgi:Na+/H+ antiporter NhaA